MSSNRLFVGGDFNQVAGNNIEKLAELNYSTGAVNTNLSFTFAGEVSRAIVGLEANPNSTRLAIVHRTTSTDGQSMRGSAVFNIANPSAPTLTNHRMSPGANAYSNYFDIQKGAISPDFSRIGIDQRTTFTDTDYRAGDKYVRCWRLFVCIQLTVGLADRHLRRKGSGPIRQEGVRPPFGFSVLTAEMREPYTHEMGASARGARSSRSDHAGFRGSRPEVSRCKRVARVTVPRQTRTVQRSRSQGEFCMHVSMTVNGTTRSHEVEPRTLLVHHIRDGVGLTGTNIGCDSSSCGSCTVHMNGESVKSCTVLAVQADGQDITTIEGLANTARADGSATGDQNWHPMQEAFQQCHALQCGYCTPGMVMAAISFLNENPNPSEIDIREGLEGNLCRCTGYHNIVKAVQSAAGGAS